jgi:hypothetical protein
MVNIYKEEVLHPDEDDGTMVDSKNDLADAVVGHRIVAVESLDHPYHSGLKGVQLTLDTGQTVEVTGTADCCAYTEVESFLLHADKIDHVITGVGTTNGYQTWHIFADWGDVLELTVGWSPGNPFYYGYGFSIQVKP